MIKPYFTRKNFIKLALAMFYSFTILFTGICLDAGGGLVSKKNPIAALGSLFNFHLIDVGASMILCLILVAIYISVFVGLFLYERQYAIVNGKKKYGPKMLATYALSFLVCAILSLGVGLLFQNPLDGENIGKAMTYLWQSICLGTVIYVALFALLGGILMFVTNYLLIDKPFKSLDKEDEVVIGDEDEINADVTANFDLPENANANAPVASGACAPGVGGAGGASGESIVRKAEELDDREKVFPGLSVLDVKHDGYVVEEIPTDKLPLDELCVRFRNYLAQEEKLYYELDTIRYFISGLAASKFLILEGLSGTGKSSLPRYFAKFINAEQLFIPVQATWRDRTSLVGYFNDFSKVYSETEFLTKLYNANYNPDQIHMFVLDEMNISRVEYYFADFLSVLEYPVEERRMKIMQLPYGFVPPAKLNDGFLQIPANVYFVGTANKDDSTFTITDKVYDRAITIDFDNRNDAFNVTGEAGRVHISYSHLQGLFDTALADVDYQMTKKDLEKLEIITDFIYEKFDITFGNRILTQIMNIVPVFMACGGKKEDALDFLLSRKVISKIEGRFEDYVKGALKELVALMEKTYGAGVLKRSEKTATSIMKRL